MPRITFDLGSASVDSRFVLREYAQAYDFLMRLYLSSFKFGNHSERLVSLVGSGKRATVILNALDNFPAARDEWLQTQTRALIELGFGVDDLDLRNDFDTPKRLHHGLYTEVLRTP